MLETDLIACRDTCKAHLSHNPVRLKRALLMARVTVEDCVDKVENRFELVLLAGHRARMISSGASLTVDRDRDKNPVVALREIAEETITPDDLKEQLIHSMQKYVEVDEPEEDEAPMLGSSDFSASHVQGLGEDDHSFDRMTEADLLKGLADLVPPDTRDDDD